MRQAGRDRCPYRSAAQRHRRLSSDRVGVRVASVNRQLAIARRATVGDIAFRGWSILSQSGASLVPRSGRTPKCVRRMQRGPLRGYGMWTAVRWELATGAPLCRWSCSRGCGESIPKRRGVRSSLPAAVQYLSLSSDRVGVRVASASATPLSGVVHHPAKRCGRAHLTSRRRADFPGWYIRPDHPG